MGIFDFFRKANKPEIKSNIRTIDISTDESFDPVSILFAQSTKTPTSISPREAYFLSERNADLGGAIEKISKAISHIPLVAKNKDKEIIENDELVNLLENPGDTQRSIQFLYEMSESFLLTTEIWIVGRGHFSRPPLTLTPIRPFNVDVTFDEFDGIPNKIETQCDKDRRIYYREVIKGKIRFIDKTGLNEIFPIIGVSNLTDEWRGRSKLVKLFYDVEMNTDGKRHNTSLLQNGMKTSNIIMPKGTIAGGGTETWNEETVNKLANYLRSFNQGAGNAGNNAILSRLAEIINTSQSNVDMDFINLLRVSRETIYNLYDIPLPLILSDAMTLSNYSVALRAFYDDAVIPVFKNIMDGIKTALEPRFKLQDGYEISYSEIDISGMRTVLMEDAKMMKEIEVNSPNEIRAVIGYKESEYGDSILVSSNKVPLEAVSVGPSFEEIEIDEQDTTEDNNTAMEEDGGEPSQEDVDGME